MEIKMNVSNNASDPAKILIVDDEIEICNSLKRHFYLMGFEVEIGLNGKEALEKLFCTRFDILISDILMPIMGGTDLLKEVNKRYPLTQIIMITGFVTIENVLTCMRYGARTCIFKPILDFDELDMEIKKSLDEIENWRAKLKYLLNMNND
jgi:DNA-binding NtrC family response regulator